MSRVLLIDDDASSRTKLSRSLARLPGVEVVEATTFADAIDRAEGETLDAVVSDIELPDGTVLELFPHLERVTGRIPAVVLSPQATGAATLSEALPIVAKTVAPTVLRDLVGSLLGHHERTLELAHYIRIAGLIRGSVQIDVMRRNEPLGVIVIRDGAPWTALDDDGDGAPAFARMIGASDVTCQCEAVSGTRERRTLFGSCADLLESAEEQLAARRREAPEDARGRTRTLPLIQRPRVLPAGSSMIPVVRADPREFERLYEAGIDALLGKRYPEAYTLFERAKQIRTTPTLEANLNRLRTLGCS